MCVPLYGFHIVSYSESIDHKNATWDKSYGLYDMQSMIMACEESTPTELLGEFVETLREVNKFKVDSAQNSNTENSSKKTTISEASNSKPSNESDIDLSKEDKSNEKFNFKINSDSKEFSGAKIGTKIKEYAKGEPLTVDGNMYFFTENGAHLAEGNDPNEKPGLNGTIYQITFSCVKSIFGKSKGFASIEGISCSSSPNAIEESKWKKYCNVYSFSSFDNQLDKIYLLNNAFINVHYDEKSNPFIDSFGLYMDKKSMLTAYRSCEEAEKLKVKAKQKGFKTLGDMVSEESNN